MIKQILTGVLVALFFILCVVLVIVGQRNIGAVGALTMLGGVAGLLILLGLYNLRYR